MLKTKNLSMVRGQTKTLTFTARDHRSQKVDLTGFEIYMAIRADVKVDPTIKLSSEDIPEWRQGIVIAPLQSSSDKGKFTVTIIPADTAELTALGADDPWLWDCWIVGPDGTRHPVIATSRLDLYPEITQIP